MDKPNRRFITFQLSQVPSGIDAKLVVNLGTILGLEPVGDSINNCLLRVSYPVLSEGPDGRAIQLPGYIIKGSVGKNYQRLSDACFEPSMEDPVHIDLAK